MPTAIIRTEADGPLAPPAHGRQTMTAYQSQPSPMRLTASRKRTTQARAAARCIQSAKVRSRSTQISCWSSHDGNAGLRRFECMDGVFQAGLEAREHLGPGGAARG